MGIYLSNMDMPKDGDGIFIDWHGNVSMIGDEIKDVPTAHAVELPPHGDLIDRDALIKSDRMVGKLMMYGGEYVYTQTEIDRAPAIIPADYEEEEMK